jgi:hypothetical protein
MRSTQEWLEPGWLALGSTQRLFPTAPSADHIKHGGLVAVQMGRRAQPWLARGKLKAGGHYSGLKGD